MNVSEVRLYRQKRRNLQGSFSELAGLSPASALEFKTHQHLREWESAASGAWKLRGALHLVVKGRAGRTPACSQDGTQPGASPRGTG